MTHPGSQYQKTASMIVISPSCLVWAPCNNNLVGPWARITAIAVRRFGAVDPRPAVALAGCQPRARVGPRGAARCRGANNCAVFAPALLAAAGCCGPAGGVRAARGRCYRAPSRPGRAVASALSMPDAAGGRHAPYSPRSAAG